MEESVALDSSKQKQFVKSVRGIKKLLKKKSPKSKKAESKIKQPEPVKEPEEPKVLPKPETVVDEKKISKKEKNKFSNKIRKRPKRGLVLLSHIPHGFYEHQMTEYFKQFGVVTNARVIRSRRTGNSKGFAFVEFKEPTVAEIVAETMNNYLMGKRLLKAVYIPPKKQKLRAMRKHWNVQFNPASEKRLKMKKAINANKTDEEELTNAKKLLATLSKTKVKLSGLGIEYGINPVDVPEALKDQVTNKSPRRELKQKIKSESAAKDGKTAKASKGTKIDAKQENQDTTKKSNEKQKKNNKNILQVNKKEQKIKQQKLDEKGIKGAEGFINLNASDGESESSDSFNSDEFDQMIDDDDDFNFDDEDDESGVETESEGDGSSDEENSTDESSDDVKVPIKPIKNKKSTPKVAIKKQQEQKVAINKQQEQKTKNNKRKNIVKAPVSPKKVKFEKHNKKALSKVVKKKK